MRNSLRIRQIVVLLVTVCALSAQIAPTASLTGTVTDPSGATVPGARIKLVNVECRRGVHIETNARLLETREARRHRFDPV